MSAKTETLTALLEARIKELEAKLAEAEAKANAAPKKSHRKYEVLALLKEGPKDTATLAKLMDTSKGNIGSLLTYLRKQDNILIYRDNQGRHFLPTKPLES